VVIKLVQKEKMKAIVCTKYGPPDVLKIKEVNIPIPNENKVLVKNYASTVTLYDVWNRTATAPAGFKTINRIATGIRKPKQPIFGIDFSGEIKAIGDKVSKFNVGDKVYGFSADMGTHAEYVCISEDKAIIKKPDYLSFEEAGTIPYGALTALTFLSKADIIEGQKVLIFGASGGIGLFAVQLAKSFGAEVTGVCSTAKLELVKSIGADHIIDYTEEDFTDREVIYDVIFDTVGKSSVSRSRKVLKKGGYYIFATFSLPKLLQMIWMRIRTGNKPIFGIVDDSPKNLSFLNELIEEGKIKTIIDKRFPFDQAEEAHAYIETRSKKGYVVINIAND